MNTLIKQLAQQADPEYTGTYDDNMGHPLVGNDTINKFATLLIQHCSHTIQNFVDHRIPAT